MIVIQGVVGAGKSTLARALSVRENITLFPEPVESNPYLERFYAEPERWAYNMQVFLLHARFKQVLEAQEIDRCIMDMSMYGNDIFAHIQHVNKQMSVVDYKNYKDLSNTLKSLVNPPKLMVFLECSLQVATQRIIKRGRHSELQAPIKYWQDLGKAYYNWYDGYKDSKKIMINVDHLNFAEDDSDEDYIIDMIMEEYNNE